MATSFKDFPPTIQTALLAAAAVILVISPSYLYVYPLMDQRTTLQKQVDDLTAENKRNEAFEQKQTEYRNRIVQLETQLQTLRSIVPDEASADDFMKIIFAAGNEANVHVRTFVAQPLAPKDFYVEMPFKIRIDGTYWALVNYFDRLAHEQRIVSVTDIDLGAPAGGGMGAYTITPNESVGANCVVTTYFNRVPGGGPPPVKH